VLGTVAIPTFDGATQRLAEVHGWERARAMLLRPGSSAVGGGDDEAHEGAAAGNRPSVERIGEADISEREAGAIRVEDLPGPAAIGGALDQASSHSEAAQTVRRGVPTCSVRTIIVGAGPEEARWRGECTCHRRSTWLALRGHSCTS
jgi:hypothetical protein